MIMTRYLMIEDERLACEEMLRMMHKVRPSYEMAGWAESIEQAVLLLKENARNTDLLLVDIRLSDGLSFEIFEQIPLDIPIIFTTAYDEYALEAFQVNSVDYLLKPIGEQELTRALEKFERCRCLRTNSPGYFRLEADILSRGKKNRFLVQVGDNYHPIETTDVAFFYSEEKATYLHLFNGRRYILNYPLDRLEQMVDSELFYRVSRNCIANIRSIKKISKYFTGRLKLHFSPDCPHEIVVSRNRTEEFLKWMDGADMTKGGSR